jgi:hypothetical protein
MPMFKRFFGGLLRAAPSAPVPRSARAVPPTLTRRVLMIVHDPPMPDGRRLHQVFGWNDPDELARQYADDLRTASGGYANFVITARLNGDFFPPKVDGFAYTPESYLRAWQTRQFRQPDAIDYQRQLQHFKIIERYNRGEFDEVWFFSFPYCGDYESTMVGPGAFWCNSPPVPHTDHARDRFVMMMFNFERGVDCMLENFGHRVESIMSHVYAQRPDNRNMWQIFTRYDQTHPGGAHCGNVHFAPSSRRDYEWGNQTPVLCYADAWYNYPDLSGAARVMRAQEWGGGEMRAHHLWWLDHLPRYMGETDGVANNWWSYILDPNLVDR